MDRRTLLKALLASPVAERSALAAIFFAAEPVLAAPPANMKDIDTLQKNWKSFVPAGTAVPAAGEPLKLSKDEWRKRLQRHWRHMQLLAEGWPGYLRQRAQLTHKISETIGQEHDLSVLVAHLAGSGTSYGSVAQVRACRQKCNKLRAELRAVPAWRALQRTGKVRVPRQWRWRLHRW